MAKKYKLALVGAGNMGSAMLGGALRGGFCQKEEVIVCEKSPEGQRRISEEYGVAVTDSVEESAKDAEMILLAVKPHQLDDVLPGVREVLSPEQIVICCAAGRTIESIEASLISVAVVGKLKVVRIMPNTPAKVSEGMCALSLNANIDEADKEKVLSLFRSFGRAEIIPESQMDIATGVSGSSPAFIYMLIEAMADAAVAEGMKRDQAYVFVSQAVLGAAKMVLETGEHPGALKDAVTSPGGTTIAGVYILEQEGLRGTIMDAVRASIQRSREL